MVGWSDIIPAPRISVPSILSVQHNHGAEQTFPATDFLQLHGSCWVLFPSHTRVREVGVCILFIQHLRQTLGASQVPWHCSKGMFTWAWRKTWCFQNLGEPRLAAQRNGGSLNWSLLPSSIFSPKQWRRRRREQNPARISGNESFQFLLRLSCHDSCLGRASPPPFSTLPGVQHWISVPQDFLATHGISVLLIVHPAMAGAGLGVNTALPQQAQDRPGCSELLFTISLFLALSCVALWLPPLPHSVPHSSPAHLQCL